MWSKTCPRATSSSTYPTGATVGEGHLQDMNTEHDVKYTGAMPIRFSKRWFSKNKILNAFVSHSIFVRVSSSSSSLNMLIILARFVIQIAKFPVMKDR
jgi:hypothetical protein